MKKKLTQIIACVMIMMMMPTGSVLAATKGSQAKAAYSNWLKGQSSKAYFTMADLNSDKVPELLYTDYYKKGDTFNFNGYESNMIVYSYLNGEVTQIGEISTISSYHIYQNKKTKQYVSKYLYGDTVIGFETLGMNSDGQLEQKNNYSVTYMVAQADYMKDGNSIVQKDYYSYVNSKYNIFDGAKFNSSKFTTLKSYKNTSKNRTAVLK